MKIFLPLIIMLFFSGSWRSEPGSRSDIASLSEWKEFYDVHFGIDIDIKDIQLPEYQEGYERLLVIAGGISFEELILTMRKEFDVIFVNTYLPNYFDHNLTNTRTNISDYAIRVRNSIASGEITNPVSGIEKIESTGYVQGAINEITLKERLILEMKYFDETGDHLDQESFTVCAGSFFARDSALSPAVGWRRGRDEYYPPYLYISECYAIFTLDGLYSRNVLVE